MINLIDVTPVIIALKGFLIAWFIVYFGPLQEFLQDVFQDYLKQFKYTRNFLTCTPCISFWAALIMSLNIFTAISAAIIAYVFMNLFRPKF
jgi:hypothetical protein